MKVNTCTAVSFQLLHHTRNLAVTIFKEVLLRSHHQQFHYTSLQGPGADFTNGSYFAILYCKFDFTCITAHYISSPLETFAQDLSREGLQELLVTQVALATCNTVRV